MMRTRQGARRWRQGGDCVRARARCFCSQFVASVVTVARVVRLGMVEAFRAAALLRRLPRYNTTCGSRRRGAERAHMPSLAPSLAVPPHLRRATRARPSCVLAPWRASAPAPWSAPRAPRPRGSACPAPAAAAPTGLPAAGARRAGARLRLHAVITSRARSGGAVCGVAVRDGERTRPRRSLPPWRPSRRRLPGAPPPRVTRAARHMLPRAAARRRLSLRAARNTQAATVSAGLAQRRLAAAVILMLICAGGALGGVLTYKSGAPPAFARDRRCMR